MLIEPPLLPLRVRVANLVLGAGHELGQVAGPRRLVIDFEADGSCRLQLANQVQRHELAADGSLGEVAGAGYAPAGDVRLLADASCAVEPGEGLPRYRQLTETLPASGRRAAVPGTALNLLTQEVETFAAGQDWLAYLRAKPEPLVLQSVAFGVTCAHEAITIWDLLEKYLLLADAAPSRFTNA